MDESNLNPYAAPASDLDDTTARPFALIPASRWARFGNYLIDYATVIVFLILLGALAGFIWGVAVADWMAGLSAVEETLLIWGVFRCYYIVFEGLFDRTLGKVITGTRVVDKFGQPPSFGQVVARSFFRLIPFESISVFQSSRVAWHDSLASTIVVKSRGNPSGVQV